MDINGGKRTVAATDPFSLYKNLQLNRMSLVRLSFELGMAVSDYNCGITTDHFAIIRATFMYLDKVKVTDLTDDELVECYAIIGQMWASVIEKDVPSATAAPVASAAQPIKAPMIASASLASMTKGVAPIKTTAKVTAAPSTLTSVVTAPASSLAKVLSTISTIKSS